MTKFEKAIQQSHDEWQEKMDAELKDKTSVEEIKESSQRVWERIKKEIGVKEQ
jgi:hypothetical protein